ncbi:MAG: xanthine dehydrogenase family protein subunit M [Gammaproteobacteria bacterium]|nr:xanthine dehydrogenase family protein subunit M [Gammaproteobacteria bacterium]
MTEIRDYVAPRSLADALRVLASGPATVLAGGTDLMPQSRAGRVRFAPTLLNVQGIDELRGVARDPGGVQIGALTTITSLLEDPLIRDRAPVLRTACDHFASSQIRNAATLGGNICNASPAGDTLVPLLVLGASVVLASAGPEGIVKRRLPLAEFLVGPGRTARRTDELLVAVQAPLPPAGWVDRYLKFGARPALDISAIALAVGGTLREGRLEDARIAFGAVAPTAIRASEAERVLSEGPLDRARIDRAVEAADATIRPISDVRASDWYRRELVHNLLRRVLNDVCDA